ncbi:MAG: NADH-quinone oxidoreductase subunit K [Campylobacterota bacterium]
MQELYIVVGIALFILGVVGVIINKHLIKKLISLNIFTSGVFLVFISLTYENSISSSIANALVLTGLVVSLAAMSLGIMLIRAYYKDKK